MSFSFLESINNILIHVYAINGRADNFRKSFRVTVRSAEKRICTRHEFTPIIGARMYAFAEPGHSLSRFLNEIAQNAVNCPKEIHF